VFSQFGVTAKDDLPVEARKKSYQKFSEAPSFLRGRIFAEGDRNPDVPYAFAKTTLLESTKDL
jgi:hypothetical protein